MSLYSFNIFAYNFQHFASELKHLIMQRNDTMDF